MTETIWIILFLFILISLFQRQSLERYLLNSLETRSVHLHHEIMMGLDEWVYVWQLFWENIIIHSYVRIVQECWQTADRYNKSM